MSDKENNEDSAKESNNKGYVILLALVFLLPICIVYLFHFKGQLDQPSAKEKSFAEYSKNIRKLSYKTDEGEVRDIKHALKQMDKEYPDFYQKYLEKKKVEERWE